VRAAIDGAGVGCSDDPSQFAHVPEGTRIVHTSRPPIGGDHYSTWYPNYGVVEESIDSGYWVHNLEHGAILLLYQCPSSCSDLVDALRGLYDELPPGHNQRQNGPRVLITPYTDMDHRLAIVAWGHKLEMDELDRNRLIQFYARFIDRGPECRSLTCPD
jgi:hypothetical protein